MVFVLLYFKLLSRPSVKIILLLEIFIHESQCEGLRENGKKLKGKYGNRKENLSI